MSGPPDRRNPRPGEGTGASGNHCTGNEQIPEHKTARRIRQAPAPPAAALQVDQGVAAVSAASFEALVAQGRFDRQIELVREHWTAVRHMWLDTLEPLRAARLGSDLPADFWFGAGMPGLAGIRPTRDGRFEFAEDGLTAVIVPAYDCIPGMLDANPERHVEELRDLVAADLDHPERYWRRRGEALVLGSVYLEIAGQEGEPVPVFSTPMSWLRSGGAGVAVLDWEWVPDLLLGHELIAEDVALGTRLEAALAPSILVMEAA